MKLKIGIAAATCIYLTFVAGCADDPKLTHEGGPVPTPTGDGGSADAGGAPATSGEPIPFCDALTVIRAKCQRCHGDPLQHGAPVPFLTYEDTQAQYYVTDQKWFEIMVKVVGNGSMPYVALNDPPASVTPPVEPLTADEKATLLGWLQQGAKPEGGTDCAP